MTTYTNLLTMFSLANATKYAENSEGTFDRLCTERLRG